MKIRAISLDAMGTFLHLAMPLADIYNAMLGELVGGSFCPLRESDVKNIWKQSYKELPASVIREHGDRYNAGFWNILAHRIIAAAQVPETLAPQYYRLMMERFVEADLYRVDPGLEAVLKFAEERSVKVAITSNWDTRLKAVLKNLNLLSEFCCVHTSSEVGFEKPSVKIFQHTIDSLRLPAREILHVGDHPHADYRGAIEAGMRAVLIQDPAPSNVEAIPALAYLPKYIETLTS